MEVYDGIKNVFDRYPAAEQKDLVCILRDIQRQLGYISKDILQEVSAYLQLSETHVTEIAYTCKDIRLEPEKGRNHIKICCGTACHVKGAQRILNNVANRLGIEPGQCTDDDLFSLEVTTCQNACRLAPLVSINGEVYMDSTPESVVQVIDKLTTLD